jgi:DNA polymerase I
MVNELSAQPEIGVDFETDGLRYADGKKPIGYGVGHLPSGRGTRPRCWYVPVAHMTAEPMADPTHARNAFRDVLVNAKALIGHNLKFDLNIARGDGWAVPEWAPLHDTLPQAHLIYERRAFQLEKLAASVPGCTFWDPMAAKDMVDSFLRRRAVAHRLTWKRDKPGELSYMSRFGHAEVPVALEGEYGCRDVAHTLLLDRAQRSEAMGVGAANEAQKRWLYDNEMMLVRALAEMEWHGQTIDGEYLTRLAWQLDEDMATRAIGLNKLFGTAWDAATWANDNQVRELLYVGLKLPVLKRTERGNQPAVDRGALLALRRAHGGRYEEGLIELAEFNARSKVRSTYTLSLVSHMCRDGKIHASFKQQGTRTGRLAGAGPNLQNIPMRHKQMARAVRLGFIVDPRTVRLYADYSQVELRALAWITGNPALVSAYRSPAWERMMAACHGKPTREWYDWYVQARQHEPNPDVHGIQATATFGVTESDPDWKIWRRAAKIINFGVPYGMGPQGLMGNPELMLDEGTAKSYFSRYHSANPEINAAKQRLFNKMVSRRGTPQFTNWAGRTVHGPGLRSSDDTIRSGEERSVFAALVQGSAGEYTRISLVRWYLAYKAGRFPGVATSTVHDEIQFDTPKSDLAYCAREARFLMEDFHGLCGNIPIVCDLETSDTTWADKKDYHIAA